MARAHLFDVKPLIFYLKESPRHRSFPRTLLLTVSHMFLCHWEQARHVVSFSLRIWRYGCCCLCFNALITRCFLFRKTSASNKSERSLSPVLPQRLKEGSLGASLREKLSKPGQSWNHQSYATALRLVSHEKRIWSRRSLEIKIADVKAHGREKVAH